MKKQLIAIKNWGKRYPIAILNIVGILVIILGSAGTFAYLLNKEIDVLQDWDVKTTVQPVGDKKPVYHPGGTLEFTSSSVKIRSAEGATSRIFDCDATNGMNAREISLPEIPANRAPGVNTPKENVIIVPAVNEFNGLPRTCRIVFNVCYKDVILWRDHCETARTNDFLVQEKILDADTVRRQIDDLENRINELETQLLGLDTVSSDNIATLPILPQIQETVETKPTAPTRQQDVQTPPIAATPVEEEPIDDRSTLSKLPVVGGLLNNLGF